MLTVLESWALLSGLGICPFVNSLSKCIQSFYVLEYKPDHTRRGVLEIYHGAPSPF